MEEMVALFLPFFMFVSYICSRKHKKMSVLYTNNDDK